MNTIWKYTKARDNYTVYEISLPEGGVELCTLEGETYVSSPAVDVDAQPEQVMGSIQQVEVTPDLRSRILAESPHCKLIASRMIERIRSAYTIDDEMYFARIGVGTALGIYQPGSDEMQEMTAFGEFVEGVRQWGREQRAELGL